MATFLDVSPKQGQELRRKSRRSEVSLAVVREGSEEHCMWTNS